MLSSAEVKSKTQEILKPVTSTLKILRVSPNVLSLIGLIFSSICSFFLIYENFLLAALFFGASGLCDVLDGALARNSRQVTKFGAFLDSFLDRYSDFFPLFGFSLLAFKHQDLQLLVLSLFSLIGSFATSYARARAESLGADCKNGMLERPERFFIILTTILVGYFSFFLTVLALLSNLTALQRLICAYRKLK